MTVQNIKTTIIGFVLIGVGAFIIVQAKHVTPEAMAIITAGAGFVAAADAKDSKEK